MASSSAIFRFCAALMPLLLQSLIIDAARPSCIGDSGKAVDWFIAYKLPHKISNPVKDGYGYLYMDSNTAGFLVSKYSAKEEQSAMGLTLSPIYNSRNKVEENDELAYVMYNDENPDGKEFFDYGHSKGDLAFTKDGGFWLVHSVPKYPNSATEGYDYPHSGTYYGQIFFCVNFNASEFDKIGLQLRFNGPHVHDFHLPTSLAQMFPNMSLLVQNRFVLNEPYNMSAKLVSSGGKNLIHFAKNKHFGNDLYAGFVAPSLKTNMLAETWQQGTGRTGSWCKPPFTVENILRIDIKADQDEYEFVNYADHSKYVLSKSSDDPVVCIGDINRMETQYSRGGGTLCTRDKAIWTVFKNLAKEIDSCDGSA